MFQGLFKRAERSIDQVVSRIVVRTLAAIPLLLAAGFASAALTAKLVEIYGAITGCALMAALFAVIGLITVAIASINSTGAPGEAPGAEAEKVAETAGSGEDKTLDAEDLLSPELRALLVSAAPVAVPGLLRGVGRNLPLIFVLAVVAFVISQFAEGPDANGEHETATGGHDPTMSAATTASAEAA